MKRTTIPAPAEIRRLVASGWIKLVAEKTGPAPAWTYWNNDHWVVALRHDTLEMERELVEIIIRHEIGHITLSHFNWECKGPDANIAQDSSVNYWLPPEMLDRIDEHFAGDPKIVAEMKKAGVKPGGCVRAEELQPALGLPGDRYVPAPFIHDKLHKAIEKQLEAWGAGAGRGDEGDRQPGGFCGGVLPTDDPVAAAAATVLAAAVGETPGRAAGGSCIPAPASSTPDWVKAVERFARAMVESCLADKRSHGRPIWPLRQLNVHVPALRPKWSYRPDVVCLLVDTSGSMMSLLPQIRPAIKYLDQHNIKTRLIAGDVKVEIDEIVKDVPELRGGGGTDIVPLWERAAEYEPRGVICFTDGYVQGWPENPGVPVLWVMDNVEAPFGERVKSG